MIIKEHYLLLVQTKLWLEKIFLMNDVQNFINHNPILTNLTQNLLQGIPGYAIYDYGRGERITTNYSVFIQDKPSIFYSDSHPYYYNLFRD